ncbi:MAG: polysaccharide deacetylase [Flaviaesturariibacter sp.]|nr:polysaccharide deacetylase [Flaviaesturariibacter sp.]
MMMRFSCNQPNAIKQGLSLKTMHRYLIKTPWWLKRLFPSYTWSMPADDKAIYLTFDDGPHPTITPWVLAELKKYNAGATFFCLGENVALYPAVYQQIVAAGHRVGNHTQHHLNGWKTPVEDYIANVAKASTLISSSLFRPPYGRIKRNQAKGIKKVLGADTKIIMWDVLSADFDTTISAEACLQNVMKHTAPGSILVFHDSEKAYPHLSYVLPLLLAQLSQQYSFKPIT